MIWNDADLNKLAARVARVERLLASDVEVIDTTTEVVTFLAGATLVRTMPEVYCDECSTGDVDQGEYPPPGAGDKVAVGSLAVDTTFVVRNGEGDAEGWWAYRVVATARNAVEP